MGLVLVTSPLINLALTVYLLVKELHQMMIAGAIVGAIASIVLPRPYPYSTFRVLSVKQDKPLG